MDLLQYAFFQNALIGSLLTAIACGIVGTYIVSRRLVFISGGITHASFGGLGLGFYLGTNPILMAMLFSILSAVIAGVAGLMTSYYIGSSAGASITLYLALFFACTFALRKKRL